MTKTANSGASEAYASNLSGSTGNTQENPKSEATGHGEARPSVREESWPTSDWLRELYTDDRCNVGTPWKQANAEFDRWLSKVKAEAWEEGHHHGEYDRYLDNIDITPNPYIKEEA